MGVMYLICSILKSDLLYLSYGRIRYYNIPVFLKSPLYCSSMCIIFCSKLSNSGVGSQVEIQMSVPDGDILHQMKMEIFQRHELPTICDANDVKSSSWNCFTIREVKSAKGKGKGIPQSIRAFARVLSCTRPEDLSDLAVEAAQNDGRLARRPFKDNSREIRAHTILLSHINRLIDQCHASIKSLLPRSFVVSASGRHSFRRQMAMDLHTGELRVLKSASAWLENYCEKLSKGVAKMVDRPTYNT
ncbi:unnamed protein product [Linum tenue]|uniref:Rubisco LSMT substrate-binding domain-containing protein n=1 Tax=Linum tenue TaxID=586396 RepID=A0AAV0JRS3_9ROSI|nr:unnamed protein product [Linum tenue]